MNLKCENDAEASRTNKRGFEFEEFDRERYREIKSAICDPPFVISDKTFIKELGLGTKIFSNFARNGIYSIGYLISLTPEQVLSIPQNGQGSLTKIQGVLKEYGLELTEDSYKRKEQLRRLKAGIERKPVET
jgi:DNA-directed RNA polymerase alpha subunit